MPQPLAAVVAAEDQEGRRVIEPGLSERAVCQKRNDLLPQLRIVHDHDVALLEIAFRRRAQRKDFRHHRCASAIQIVRPSESKAETQPQLHPALLRLSAIVSQYFIQCASVFAPREQP